MNIEGRVHPQHDLGVQFEKIIRHEPFLLRSARAYPKKVRLCHGYLFDQAHFLFVIKWTKWRGVGVNGVQALVFGGQASCQFFGYSNIAALKEVRVTLL